MIAVSSRHECQSYESINPKDKEVITAMTANQYRAAIAKLEMSQRAAARLFHVDERTSRRWALGEISVPKDVAEALQSMIVGDVTKQDVEAEYARQ